MDLGTQEAILRLVNQHGKESLLVLLGAPDAESAEISAETVIIGDPTYAGPLAEAQLGLDVYHILEEEVKSWIPAETWDDQVGLMADVLDAEDPLRVGLIGMFGNRWANLAAMEADFVLVLGSKLDLGTIGADVNAWGKGRTIYQVDCDPGEMGRVRRARTILADLGEFCRSALEVARDHAPPGRPQWMQRLEELRQAWPDTNELGDCDGINPNVLARELSAASPGECDFVIDAGQHLWWTAQSIQPRLGQRFLPSLGLGPCGYSLPAAIGVALGSHRPAVVVVGDGAFQFNLQELQTVVRNKLPIKILLIDNQCHGSVRQFQEENLEGRYPTTVIDYDTPDFARVAEAYGIRSREVSDPDGVADALGWFWEDPLDAALLRVEIPMLLNVYPNVPFGAPLNAMAGRPGLEPSRAAVAVQGR